MLMKDTKVTITIGIATYNGESFIKRVIDSIINQSLSNFEILISDDVLQFLFSAVLIPVTTYQITRHYYPLPNLVLVTEDETTHERGNC